MALFHENDQVLITKALDKNKGPFGPLFVLKLRLPIKASWRQ
jgi:hypothetical protein